MNNIKNPKIISFTFSILICFLWFSFLNRTLSHSDPIGLKLSFYYIILTPFIFYFTAKLMNYALEKHNINIQEIIPEEQRIEVKKENKPIFSWWTFILIIPMLVVTILFVILFWESIF